MIFSYPPALDLGLKIEFVLLFCGSPTFRSRLLSSPHISRHSCSELLDVRRDMERRSSEPCSAGWLYVNKKRRERGK